MNALPEPWLESDSALKSALIDKAIEQLVSSAHSGPSPAAKQVMGDMEAFLSGVLVFHCANKRSMI